MMDGSQPQGKPMRRATIKDVAEKAKVSLKTVSRVINNEPSVMQATRARVLRAIAELDYARSVRAQPAQRHYFVIGLVYDNPNPYHIIGVQNGVLAACRETGFGLQIHPCDSSSPLLADELADWVQRSRLAGLVLTAPMSERRDLIQALTARGIKLVRIIAATEDPADGACVFVDDREAAYEITEHLIQLGHQRIGFLWGGSSHRSSGERYAGYEAALKDYGMTVDKHLVVQGRLHLRRWFPWGAPPAGAARTAHRHLRFQRRNRCRRAGRRQVGRHERAVRPVHRRFRGQPVLAPVVATADHRQAGHRGHRPPRRAPADRTTAQRRLRRCAGTAAQPGLRAATGGARFDRADAPGRRTPLPSDPA